MYEGPNGLEARAITRFEQNPIAVESPRHRARCRFGRPRRLRGPAQRFGRANSGFGFGGKVAVPFEVEVTMSETAETLVGS